MRRSWKAKQEGSSRKINNFSVGAFGKEAVYCDCEEVTEAALRTSWTDYNPGRRFIACDKIGDGCKFFEWVDEPTCERGKQILPGLLKKINKHEKERESMKKQIMWLRVKLVLCMIFIMVVGLGLMYLKIHGWMYSKIRCNRR